MLRPPQSCLLQSLQCARIGFLVAKNDQENTISKIVSQSTQFVPYTSDSDYPYCSYTTKD